MSKDHPRYKEWTIGTWEPVWKDVDGKPTIDRTQRAYQDTVWELVSSDTPDATPTPAIGWKIEMTNRDGTPYLNTKGLPGWTTYRKNRDTKPVFADRDSITDIPKIAPTLRHIRGLWVPTPEQYGTQLLTSIVHEYEKFMREHGKNEVISWDHEDLNISFFHEDRPGTGKWLRIKKWEQSYKILLTQRYKRDNDRGAWSVYIDKESASGGSSSPRTYQNYKLAPEWDSYFTARIVTEQTANAAERELTEANIALLEEVYRLFQ